MAKIKLNSLPEGFEIKDGKVMKKMQQGGMTGDQSNYGLVTSPYHLTDQFNNEGDLSLRYSLSSVPRDAANIEAEGGETVLTDLNDDGQFGLYNITGARHSSGGVPMFLPEQSFIFSDTKDMKFNKNELADYGIYSRKKMTPAKVSKKYQLNPYIGAMADPNADKIQARSSELMLDKNMMGLSKLAFGQESKKKFSDGVPVSAYPYLVSKGIDPMEFTQKIENITQQQAAQKMLAAMSPEQQAQVMAMQEFMSQADQPGQEQPMAAYGMELPKAQNLGQFPSTKKPNLGMFDRNNNGILDALENLTQDPYESDKSNVVINTRPEINNTNKINSKKTNVAFDPEKAAYYDQLGIDINTLGIGASKFQDMQPLENIKGAYYGDASKNNQGFKESWKGIYPDLDKLTASIDSWTSKDKNPEVEKFQKWLNESYIPNEVASISKKSADVGKPLSETAIKKLQEDLKKDYGFDPNQKGKGIDGDYGTFTSSRRPIGYGPSKGTSVVEKTKENVEPGDVNSPYVPPEYDFFTQDLIKMGALGMRNREFLPPFQPQVEIPNVKYVLEEPTRQLADVNEQLNIASNAFGTFGGPQSLNSRIAQAQGNALKANANTFAQVHGRNIGTINQGLMANAQLQARAQAEQRDRSVNEYDATNLTIQNYVDEKNLDREQMADLSANAYTNAANAYNLSSIFDQYNIDPSRAGLINFTNPRMLEGSKSGQQGMTSEQIMNLATELNAKGMKVDGNKLLDVFLGQSNTAKDPRAEAFKNMQASYAGSGYKSSKGKEIKKYAVPFYTGKVGY